MNKSFILRNKLYRFCFLLFSFFLFTYLLYFLISGDRGITSYYKISKKYFLIKENHDLLVSKNNSLEDKISRLSPNSLDLDYLDEQLRLKTGKIIENEIIIKLED